MIDATVSDGAAPDPVDPLDLFSPYVAGWFRGTFGVPTPPQAQGWPVIARGDHALIISPTGSGKTLTAFLWSLDTLFRELSARDVPLALAEAAGKALARRASGGRGVRGNSAPRTRHAALAPGIRVVYVSPLKALNNDVERNLQVPLAGIRRQAERAGIELPQVRVAVRTGDTPSNERQSMLRHPPHVLITTPESLYLMLTGERARQLFARVHTVILDEIHTVVGSKRGAHLALTLERLERIVSQGAAVAARLGEAVQVPHRLQRIGLSATVRPLETAARFLGGQELRPAAADLQAEEEGLPSTLTIGVHPCAAAVAKDLAPRSVTVVDAAYKKSLDLQVVTAVEDFRHLPGNSIWTAIIPEVNRLVEQHHTTLIFCNSRRLAERTADRLNEHRFLAALAGMERSPQPNPLPKGDEVSPPLLLGEAGRRAGEDSTSPRAAQGSGQRGSAGSALNTQHSALRSDLGMFAAGVDASQLEAVGLLPIRAHHGSMSKVARLEMEEMLKAGSLPALVATSSLELGIDIGEIDLVVQLQSPKSVASGLQRIGRSGHLVGQTSVGRIFTSHVEDVVEAAAVAYSMRRGEIEETHTPENPLDVLAQQIMAMVGAEDWAYDDLFATIRGAYPYRNLSEPAYRGVLEMLSGKYADSVSRHLRARLSWDRVNNRLAALPGSRLLATQSGGTIPDRGLYSLVLTDRKTKIGELDEEFVFESRTGDTFLLGSQVWRVADIAEDRVLVEPAPGETPRMPFWRGDFPWRPYDLGKRIGAFRRKLADMLSSLSPEELEALLNWDVEKPQSRSDEPQSKIQNPKSKIEAFLRDECALDDHSTRQVIDHVARQLDAAGQIATDRSVIVELFDDAVGDPRMVIHSPFGGRVNGPWGLALAGLIRERTGVDPQVTTGDDGILFRFAAGDDRLPHLPATEMGTVEGAQALAADLVAQLTSAEARERLLNELPNSAVFGAQFRMNAARALLLPRQRAGKRTPLWLTRLQAKDLLQAVQRFKDFPILLETYRDCLRDVMDLDGLTEVLHQIQRGEIQVTVHESELPSPVAMGLDYRMAMQYVYEYDAPRGEKQLAALALDRTLLADLLQDRSLAALLKPEAVATVAERVSHTGPEARARSAEELAQILYDLGDLTEEEIAERCADGPDRREWVRQLAAAGRIGQRDLGATGELRWIHAERRDEYDRLHDHPLLVLRRRLMHSGPTTAGDLATRYGLSEGQVRDALQTLGREVVPGEFTPGAGEQWIDRRTLEQIHRRTLSLLRKEVQPVPLSAYAAFLHQWHSVSPAQPGSDVETRGHGEGSLSRILQQLRGCFIPALAYQRDVFPARWPAFDIGELAERCQAGEVLWVAQGGRDPRRARVAFCFRGEGGLFLDRAPEEATLQELTPSARAVYDFLTAEGAALLPDIVDGAALDRATAQQALVELVLASLVTNDTLAALHAVLGYEPPVTTRPGSRSTLEAQLAARMPDHPRRLTPGGLRDARRRARDTVAARLGGGASNEGRVASGGVAGPRYSLLDPRPSTSWTGRWSLVYRQSFLGHPLTEGERAMRQARQLLQRWGVVTKACLERESPAFQWETLYPVLSYLEMRGEVRRGYFVAGLPGLQFALPEVVEQLRATNASRRPPADAADVPPVVLSAVDPAQVFGTGDLGVPLRFSRVAATAAALHQGDPVAAMTTAEETGASVLAGPDHPALVPCLRALARWWQARQRLRLKVERWEDADAAADGGVAERPRGEQLLLADPPSHLLAALEAAGFVREGAAMSWVER